MFCGRVPIESIERKYSFIIIALFCEMDIITKNVQLHEKKLLFFFFLRFAKNKNTPRYGHFFVKHNLSGHPDLTWSRSLNAVTRTDIFFFF